MSRRDRLASYFGLADDRHPVSPHRSRRVFAANVVIWTALLAINTLRFAVKPNVWTAVLIAGAIFALITFAFARIRTRK